MGGSLLFEEISKVTEQYGLPNVHTNIKNFVETGTYKAATTIMASQHYKQVFTTEIHKGLHEEAMQKVRDMNITNISFLQGDSLQLLPLIVPNVLKQGSVFFLDAHISGSDSGWNNSVRVPLIEELTIILSHTKRDKLGPSLFIFDDLRFWNNQENQAWDWEHISKEGILNIFKNYEVPVHSSVEFNDRFWVFTSVN